MENENNVKNNVQTTPVDQAVVNNAPAQPQATNVVENNVTKAHINISTPYRNIPSLSFL